MNWKLFLLLTILFLNSCENSRPKQEIIFSYPNPEKEFIKQHGIFKTIFVAINSSVTDTIGYESFDSLGFVVKQYSKYEGTAIFSIDSNGFIQSKEFITDFVASYKTKYKKEDLNALLYWYSSNTEIKNLLDSTIYTFSSQKKLIHEVGYIHDDQGRGRRYSKSYSYNEKGKLTKIVTLRPYLLNPDLTKIHLKGESIGFISPFEPVVPKFIETYFYENGKIAKKQMSFFNDSHSNPFSQIITLYDSAQLKLKTIINDSMQVKYIHLTEN